VSSVATATPFLALFLIAARVELRNERHAQRGPRAHRPAPHEPVALKDRLNVVTP